MNAFPPAYSAPHRGSPTLPHAVDDADDRWAALSAATGLVAALAEAEFETTSFGTGDFAALLRQAEPWRAERAEQGVADLAAIMEPGIAALLSVSARGADPRAAARSLWREIIAAREAILALLNPTRA